MKTLIKLFVVIFILGFTVNIDGQIKLNLKNKINNALNNKANQKTDQSIDKGLDGVEKGAKDAAKGDKSKDQSQQAQKNQQQDAGKAADNNAEAADNKEAKEQETGKTPFESYSKYDFIPGEKVIFYEDFSQDAVGDFPTQWNTNGSGEVVTTNLYPGHWMKFVGNESVWTDALLKLPENYTINPDVRVKIVGHTDSDGVDAANLDLSKRRGESVKNELVKTFGIDASRLESDGMGETQPVAKNDTPANKALNRRVEFIKL